MYKIPEKFRISNPALEVLFGKGDSTSGAFRIPLTEMKKQNSEALYVIASNGQGWEHVSIHVHNDKACVSRMPNWTEMCFIKGIFWDAEDCVIQYHPPESEYVNNHEHTLHLWRPIGIELPRPPHELVGIKN